ncbi:MAG: M20 family metallopeptidase [Spirochaetota bacterium]
MTTKKAKINNGRLQKIFRDMVDIYSPSGKEGAIVGFLDGFLKGADVPAVRQPVEDGRDNLLILSPRENAQVVFVGHLDTVAAPDYMNYRFELDDDEVYGLGTADMKGGCAAMIEAFTAYCRAHDGDLPASLALVVGEEETGDGAQTFVDEYHYPWAIVGEPTSLVPCFSHFGYLELELTTYGRRVHASLAQKEHNAIRSMLTMLLSLTEYLDGSRHEVIYNIRDMQSSQAGFAVPDRCDVYVDLHVPPQFGIGDLSFEIEEVIAGQLDDSAQLHDSLVFSTIHAGYDLPSRGYFPELLKDVLTARSMKWEPTSFRSDSDATILWGAGIKPVILGPGQLAKAHTSDESVRMTEVSQSAQVYLDILYALDANGSS